MNWNKEIEKTMNHTYLVLSRNTYFENKDKEDYKLPMLLQNKIPGLLTASQQAINGENRLYYEISTLESMEEIFEKKEMDYNSVCEILKGCISIYSDIEEYMLDGEQLILTPEYIFIEPESRRPHFVYYPYYSSDSREAFMRLMDYILEKLDHSDHSTVMLGYNAHRVTRNRNFTMQEIENVILENPEEKVFINEIQEEVNIDEVNTFETVEEIVVENTNEIEKVKPNIKDKLSGKFNFKEEKSFEKINGNTLSMEVIGMIISGAIISLLSGFLLYSVNTGLFLITDEEVLYMIGGISMTFMTLIMLAYTYFKKRNILQAKKL